MNKHKQLIEAALFMASEPLSLKELSRITGLSSLGRLQEMIYELQQEYRERGIHIIKIGNRWQMQVRPDLLDAVAHLAPYTDLSEGAKRTLALIVYKEPVSQAEIVRIQGNKAYTYIKQLLKAGLIKAEPKGRTKMLSLTSECKDYFGEEIKKIKERIAKKFNG